MLVHVHPVPKPFPIEVGQKVVLYPAGNLNRDDEFKFREGVVTKIGRKYFQVDGSYMITKDHFVDKDMPDYNGGFYVFESEDALRYAFDLQMKIQLIKELSHNMGLLTPEECTSIFYAIPEHLRKRLWVKLYGEDKQ